MYVYVHVRVLNHHDEALGEHSRHHFKEATYADSSSNRIRSECPNPIKLCDHTLYDMLQEISTVVLGIFSGRNASITRNAPLSVACALHT